MKFFIVLGIFAALAMHATFADETKESTPAASSAVTTAATKSGSSSDSGTYTFPRASGSGVLKFCLRRDRYYQFSKNKIFYERTFYNVP